MKFLPSALLVLGCLFITLGFYQLNQYWIASSTIAPSLAQLNTVLNDPVALQAAGMNASDLEASKSLVFAGTNAMLQAAAFDLLVGLVLLLASWLKSKGDAK